MLFTFLNFYPQRIITNYSHICCIESAAVVSLFVLLPTVCLAFPKCHFTVSVLIVGRFIFSPYSMQNILLAVTWPSNNDFIQNQVSSAKKYTLRCTFCSSFSHAEPSNSKINLESPKVASAYPTHSPDCTVCLDVETKCLVTY